MAQPFESERMAEDQALTLIRMVIGSVWGLELLLLLRRERGRNWTRDDLVRELRASNGLIEQNLASLVAGGLVRQEDDRFAYGPASPLLEEACAALERAYRERPVAVINLIVGQSTSKVQSFADAFRFKKGTE